MKRDMTVSMVRTREKRSASNAVKQGSDDARWAAVEARDKGADGQFVFSVATTGIYCRPSCPARHAKRSNVAFHDIWEEAEKAGYRPCKRCKPKEKSLEAQLAAKVAAACRSIETADEEHSLASLAEAAGLSPHHFHRIFKRVTGVTPKDYAVALRQKRVRAELKRSRTVTDAIHDAGFGSSGRFYANSSAALGMTPTEFRADGKDTEIKFAIGSSSLGAILVATSERGVAAIFLGDTPSALERELMAQFPRARLVGGDGKFKKLVAEVVAFVDAPRAKFNLPLDIRGTAFQHRVWKALCDIPAGRTVTYAEIARRIGDPRAVRAVAGACAANKIAIAIPCHRVVRTDGGLSGYRWGGERKRALLDREAKSGKQKP